MSWIRITVIAPFFLLALLAFKCATHQVKAEHTRDGAVFTVDSTTDAVDAAPGDRVCADAAHRCTLRAAIQETNKLEGADRIILPSNTYTLTIAGVDEDLAATGDLDILDNLTISGTGANNAVIDANDLDRVLQITVNATVNLNDLSVTNGSLKKQDGSQDGGGGIKNLGVLTLTNTTVRDNTADGFEGGGILNVGGTVTIERSTVSDNRAVEDGGGLANDGGGSVKLLNSTVSGNWAGVGGGIGNITGTVTLESSTIAFNTANVSGGGVWNGGAAYLKNTIMSKNKSSGGASDCFGTLVSQRYNLVESTSDCLIAGDAKGNLIGLDPLLGPLQDNGGPTWTHDLTSDSPALDATGDAVCPGEDQRGLHRPFDGDSDGVALCDMGAIEYRVWFDGSFLPMVMRP